MEKHADSRGIVEFIQKKLIEAAIPEDVKQMQAYMKTEMPFYGVRSGKRKKIVKELKKKFPIDCQKKYNQFISEIWELEHREEKYISISLAREWAAFITLEALPIYEKMIREGEWWDFVDEIAQHLIGRLLAKNQLKMNEILGQWISDENLWIRRTAILSYNRHKENTDEEKLFDYCLRCSGDTDFFIRKAIGWALREYSKTSKKSVSEFVRLNEEKLSNLSKKEGMRHILLNP